MNYNNMRPAQNNGNQQYSGGHGGFQGNYGRGNQQNSRGNNNQGYGYGNGQAKKKSGCKMQTGFTTKKGEYRDSVLITGWNKSGARGFIKFIAAERKDPDKAQTKNKDYVNFAVKVQFADGVKWFNGLYRISNGKLTIPDLEMVANPKAANGGYFGKFYKSK